MQNSCHWSFSLFETFRERESIFWQPPCTYHWLSQTEFISRFHWVERPVFVSNISYAFTQTESGCSERSGPRSRDSGSSCPSSDTLMTSGQVAWPLLYLFVLTRGIKICALAPGLVQRHVVRLNGTKAFDVLGAKASFALEDLFRKN